MTKASARLTGHLLGDALFDTSDFQETVFVEKKIPSESEVVLGILKKKKLMEVSFQTKFKISTLTYCVLYAMGIYQALEILNLL